MSSHDHLILALDVAGHPRKWIDHERAIFYHAKGMVAWSVGDDIRTYYGGIRRIDGQRSSLSSAPIIAIKSDEKLKLGPKVGKVALTNTALFARDRHLCAYCGTKHTAAQLSRDHIVPVCQNGANTWMNVVTACRSCNTRKSDSPVGEGRWKLLYVPYVPVLNEWLILQNRRILTDQMDFLLAGVPKHSRIWEDLKDGKLQ